MKKNGLASDWWQEGERTAREYFAWLEHDFPEYFAELSRKLMFRLRYFNEQRPESSKTLTFKVKLIIKYLRPDINKK